MYSLVYYNRLEEERRILQRKVFNALKRSEG